MHMYLYLFVIVAGSWSWTTFINLMYKYGRNLLWSILKMMERKTPIRVLDRTLPSPWPILEMKTSLRIPKYSTRLTITEILGKCLHGIWWWSFKHYLETNDKHSLPRKEPQQRHCTIFIIRAETSSMTPQSQDGHQLRLRMFLTF